MEPGSTELVKSVLEVDMILVDGTLAIERLTIGALALPHAAIELPFALIPPGGDSARTIADQRLYGSLEKNKMTNSKHRGKGQLNQTALQHDDNGE